MLTNDRHEKIISILQRKKYMKPKELTKELYASESTVRRDLLALEKMGLIHRNHGQISLFENNEPAHQVRVGEYFKEKNYIAQIAVNYIENGMTLFIDSSTTSNALCTYINQFKNLTIITNGLKTATDLSLNSDNNVLVTSGMLKPYSSSLLGQTTSDFIHTFNADIAFCSCRRLDKSGVYESDFQQGYLKNAMIAKSKMAILLCDSSKFYKKDFYGFTTYKDIHTIVTDQKPDNPFLETCKTYNCEVDW